ncbi:MAG: aldo/keto reductase [Actinomycetota bacterium]|nr:aldo/keto reductase [Actinomycetota bacterium]
MSAPALPRARIGDSGVEVTRFVLGCAPIGGLYSAVDETTARGALDAAWRGGVRAFDVAPHYGVGLAEERLGRFLATVPGEQVTVSSKVGRLLVDTDEDVEGVDEFYGTPRRRRVRDYSRDGVRRSVLESLERLGRDRLDVALVHDPEGHESQALDEGYRALDDLRSEGVVGAIGVGTNISAVASWFVERADLDCVLVAGRYSLLGDDGATELFGACVRRDVSILVGGVFRSGILARPGRGAHVDYEPAPGDLVDRVARIEAVCARHSVALPAAAMQFVLSRPEVDAVVVGAASEAEVVENLAHFAATVPEDVFEELASLDLAPPTARRGRGQRSDDERAETPKER